MEQQRIALHLPGVALAAADRATTFPIGRSGLYRLPGDRRGTTIRCGRGAVWVTQPGDPVDHILSAGESWDVTRAGLVLVQGLSEAAVELKPAAGRR